jgi:pyrophosphatase PpaX
VLVDSIAAIRDAYAATAARYRLVFGEREFARVKHLPLLEGYRCLDPSGDARQRREFHLRVLRERIREIGLFPGVRAVLAAAAAHGIRLGAVTSYGEFAEALLVGNGIYAYFDCLVTHEEVRRPKPHPDAIVRALDLLGVDPAATRAAVHIGDTADDVAAGKRAGTVTVGVTGGVSGEADIRSAQPDYVLRSFAEMRLFVACQLDASLLASWTGHGAFTMGDGP